MAESQQDFEKRLKAVAEANRILGIAKPQAPAITGAALDSGGFGTGAKPSVPMNRDSYEGATLGGGVPSARPRVPGAEGPTVASAPAAPATSVPATPFPQGEAALGNGPQTMPDQNFGPPAPPPKEEPGLASKAFGSLKRGIGVAAQGALNGLGGAGPAIGSALAQGNGNAPPAPAPAPASNTEPLGPPAPNTTQVNPVFRSKYGAGGGRMTPGGWVPSEMSVHSEQGIEAPEQAKAAFAEAGGAQLKAADLQKQNEQAFGHNVFNAELTRQQAIQQANDAHAKIQADRQAQVAQQLAAIDNFNQQANAQVQSPEQIWNDRGALARVFGAIAVGLGGLAQRRNGGRNGPADIIAAGVNQEVDSQIRNQQTAKEGSARQEKLLGLHLDALKDQDMAVDATKKGMFENALSLLEQERIKKGIMDTDPNYLNVKAGILNHLGDLDNKLQVQGTDKVQRAYSEKYRPPQLLGPAGGKPLVKPSIITIPASDKTGEKEIHLAVPEVMHKDLADMQGSTNALIQLNKDALQSRQRLRDATSGGIKDPIEAAKVAATERRNLQDLTTRKVHLLQKAEKEGVTRNEDFKREMEAGIDYSGGIGGHNILTDTDRLLERQSNSLQNLQDQHVRGSTPQIVTPTYDEDGNIGWLPTGQIYRGRSVAPEGSQVEK